MMTDRDKYIMKRVREHYNEIKNKYEVVGIFLQGSQNYELDIYEADYKSDIDTKAIILPSFEDIVYNREPISTTLVLDNNEHIDLKDVRIMFDTFKKQNVNFIEILFTKFKIINPKYKELFKPVLDHREEIARLDYNKALNCQAGMSEQKYVALEHPYPTIKDKIDKFGYDCYSEDTYFLTDSGYKLFDEINATDKLATMDNNGDIEFQNYISKIDKITNECIYDIETRYTHFTVTGGHNLLCSKVKAPCKNRKYIPEYGNWGLTKLNYCLKNQRYNHIISFPKNGNAEYPISDDMLQLIGAYVSEGTINFRNGKPKTLIICQTGHGKDDFIKMMDNISFNYHKYTVKRKNKDLIEYKWHFSKEIAEQFLLMCGHGSKTKRLPGFIYKLSQRQCKLLLDTLLLGDGSFYSNRATYYTNSNNLAKDVYTLSLLSGYETKLNGGYLDTREYNNGKCIMYHIEIKYRKIAPSYIKLSEHEKDRNGHIQSIKKIAQRVVCFEVPNGNLVTMKNGKSAVQGNCKQLHHILRMNDFIRKYIKGVSYEKCLIPNNKDYLIEIKRGKLPLESARKLAQSTNRETYQLSKDNKDPNELIDVSMISLLDNVKYNLLKQRFKEELLGV